MRATVILALAGVASTFTAPSVAGSTEQKILENGAQGIDSSAPRKLHGKFLHITDLHPDPYYKSHTSTSTCHRGHGASGPLGTPLSDCDSPYSLIDATFSFLNTSLLSTLDFVIWTGDSARHDRDEEIPRTAAEIVDTNTYVAQKFTSLFVDAGIPVIPTLGNNDVLPHNILLGGPNAWLRRYTNIWRTFVPEPQRHQFQRGGWFHVDVLPGRLAVVSLNTLYFFDRNSGVDGCASKGEPGYEHLTWLGIQLSSMRGRGVKAVLMGHVPPARTGGKRLWDESCWEGYTGLVGRFRDVVVGAVYGHMNIDHFFLQDGWEVDGDELGREVLGEDFNAKSAGDYLEELRGVFSKMPDPRDALGGNDDDDDEGGGGSTTGKKKRKKALKEMGGEWAERYQVSLVGPSVVPNYFPTLRVVEYNISSLEGVGASLPTTTRFSGEEEEEEVGMYELLDAEREEEDRDNAGSVDAQGKKKKGKKDKDKKKKKKKNNGKNKPTPPHLKLPPPPPPGTPPGPAYSPQPLSWTGYTQYFANLSATEDDSDGEDGKKRKGSGRGGELTYEVEYSTFNDTEGFGLEDLTVRSYLGLACRIGQAEGNGGGGKGKGGKKEKGGKGGKKRERERVWRVFVERAFVGTRKEVEIGMFGEDGGDGEGEEL